MSTRKYNIVVFGGTGTSGKDVIIEITKYLESASPDKKFTWAVAGRNVKKLEEALIEMSGFLRKDLSGVDIIKADVEDAESLRDMASKCDVVLNFVGPYLLYGEAVVKACVAEGTHHLDLSVEEQYLEGMQLKYHQEAKKSGAIIIGAAGICSILSDYGATFLAENFKGRLNSVESYLNVLEGKGSTDVPQMHFGTFNSIIMRFHRISELEDLRRQLYPNDKEAYYKFKYPFKLKQIRYSKSLESWCFSTPFPDSTVMERTQRYKFYEEEQTPFQTNFFIQVPNLLYAILVYLLILFGAPLMKYKWFFNFIQDHPRMCTLGFATEEYVQGQGADIPFTWTLIGRGWEEDSDPMASPPDKKTILKFKGKDSSHQGTAVPMLQAGLSLIHEREKIRLSGGVFTPGTALAGTTLAQRLHQRGIKFSFEK